MPSAFFMEGMKKALAGIATHWTDARHDLLRL